MLQSRRGFLIGAGALLTTAFVKDARSFTRQVRLPVDRPDSITPDPLPGASGCSPSSDAGPADLIKTVATPSL